MGKHRGNTGEEWPKRLDLSDPGISKILTDAFAKLKDGGNGILPLLRACFPEFSGENGPESFFRAIGLLDGKGELAADRGKIPLRALCEARGQFSDALGAFVDSAEISPGDIALLEGPINDAVEAVRRRVEEWKKEQAGARQDDQRGFRDLQKNIARPRSNVEIGKTLLRGTLKVEIGKNGDVMMSFGADNVVFFNSPFADRPVLVESGLMVRSANGVLEKLSGKIKKGGRVSVDCIARVVDLKIVQRDERVNDHDFYVDVVSISPESLMAARAVDVGGARIPLMDLYKVEDPEGEKVKEGEGFRGFKEIEMGETEINGTLFVENSSVGSLVSHYLDAEFNMPKDGNVYYCDAGNGKTLFLPANIPTSPNEGGRLMEELPYNIPSGGKCSLDTVIVIAGDFSDGVVKSDRLCAEIKSVGDRVNGKSLENLSEGAVLDGVWEIIVDDQGTVCRAVFWPDGLDKFSYYADHNDRKILAPDIFFAETYYAKHCFPQETSFKKGRNYFKGQGKFRHVTDLNRVQHGFAPDYKFIFEPVNITKELNVEERSRTEEKLIVPGDHVSGFLHIGTSSPGAVFAQFSLDRNSVGDKEFLDTSVEGMGRMRIIGLNFVHQFTISGERKLKERFGDFEIGERAIFKCSAEFLGCSSCFASEVRIEQIGEKTGDDRGECKVVDFKEGDININSARLRGKLVVKGFDINNWYFVLNEGMGPYHFDSMDRFGGSQRVSLDSESKLKISKYGGKALSCDVLNIIAGRDEKGAATERIFDVEVFLKSDQLYGGALACVARVGKELTAPKSDVETKGLSKNDPGDREEKLNSLARTLGGERAHQGFADGRNRLETGCILRGKLVVDNSDPVRGSILTFVFEDDKPRFCFCDLTMYTVGRQLPVVNGDEMAGVLSCIPPQGTKISVDCEVMFCDPDSRYLECSVFLLKVLESVEKT